MITLQPYIAEVESYHLLPLEHRWIFNKLELAERFDAGPCGPVGTWMPRGEFCLRPIMNVGGMARGGFKKIVIEAARGIVHDPCGYCWTPWQDDFRRYTLFINDEFFARSGTVEIIGDIEVSKPLDERMELPKQLRGISRYMLVETLGDTIIDVGPRHMSEEMHEEVISDYRKTDPSYEPENKSIGFQPRMRRVYMPKFGGWRLESIEASRQTWSEARD